MSSPSRAGKILRSPDSAARVVPGAVRKSPARGRGGKLKLEPDIDLVSSLKEGGDPLSVPLGTQVRNVWFYCGAASSALLSFLQQSCIPG